MPRSFNSDSKKPFYVSLRPSTVSRARALNLDINSICEHAIDLAAGRDPEEVEMKSLEREISILRADLGAKEARYRQLKENLDRVINNARWLINEISFKAD